MYEYFGLEDREYEVQVLMSTYIGTGWFMASME